MSAINASIPLQGQLPRLDSPIQQAQGAYSVQELINAVQLQKQQQAQAAINQQRSQIQLRQEQQAEQDQQLIRSLAPQFSKKNADGTGTFDFEGLINEAQNRGVNPAMLNQMRMQNYQMIEAASKAGTEKLANETAHNKAAYEIIEGIKPIDDPQQRETAYQRGLNRLKTLGMDTSHLPGNAPNNKALEAYETELGMHGQLISDAKTLADTNKANAEAAEKEWQKFPNLGVMVNTRTGEQKNIAGGGMMTPEMMQARYVALGQKQAQGQPLNPEEAAFRKSFKDFKEIVPQFNFALQNQGTTGAASDVAKRFGMTPEAFDQLAEKFSSTGTLPPVGRGGPSLALNKAIMNRAGELHPGQSLSANSAEYKANQASLTKLQQQSDAVNAFESTALKNLDQAIKAMKAVPDVGVRFGNIPVRMLTGEMIGTEAQSKLKTALGTARPEIARVLNSANASGVLTNEARDEVKEILDGNLPISSFLGQADQLITDMKNRKQSYADQISEIQRRLGGKKTEGTSDNTEEHPFFSQFGGKVRKE